MKKVSAAEAIRAIPDGSNVVFPASTIELAALVPAFQGEVERFHRLTLYSGYSFGDYRFLAHGLGSHFRYASWQAAPHIRHLFAEGKADYVPMRFGEVTRIVSKSGPIQPHVVLVQVSPPRRGYVSLGVSVSLYQDFIRSASLVIAEINPHMAIGRPPSTPTRCTPGSVANCGCSVRTSQSVSAETVRSLEVKLR